LTFTDFLYLSKYMSFKQNVRPFGLAAFEATHANASITLEGFKKLRWMHFNVG